MQGTRLAYQRVFRWQESALDCAKMILVNSKASLYADSFIASPFRGNGWSDFHSTTTRRESLTAGENRKEKAHAVNVGNLNANQMET